MVCTWSPALHQVNLSVQTSSCLNTDHRRAYCTGIVPCNLLRNPAGWYQHTHFPDEQTDIFKAGQPRRQDSVPGWPDSRTQSLTSELHPRGSGDGTPPPLGWMRFQVVDPESEIGSSHDGSSCSQTRRKGEISPRNPYVSASPFPLGDPPSPPLPS